MIYYFQVIYNYVFHTLSCLAVNQVTCNCDVLLVIYQSYCDDLAFLILVGWFLGWQIFPEPFWCSQSVENKNKIKHSNWNLFSFKRNSQSIRREKKKIKKVLLWRIYIRFSNLRYNEATWCWCEPTCQCHNPNRCNMLNVYLMHLACLHIPGMTSPWKPVH